MAAALWHDYNSDASLYRNARRRCCEQRNNAGKPPSAIRKHGGRQQISRRSRHRGSLLFWQPDRSRFGRSRPESKHESRRKRSCRTRNKHRFLGRVPRQRCKRNASAARHRRGKHPRRSGNIRGPLELGPERGQRASKRYGTMADLRYTVVIEPDDGAFSVIVPAFPEISTFGETHESALEMARDAIRLSLEY